MTEQELVDFAIEQINSRDDWIVDGHGNVLKGPRSGGTYSRIRIGQGLGPPIRGVVGDVDIMDEKLGTLLMDAVKDRARELQTLEITRLFDPDEPSAETLIQIQTRFHRSGMMMMDLDDQFESDLLEYFKDGDDVFREWARHIRLKRIECERAKSSEKKSGFSWGARVASWCAAVTDPNR